MYILQAFRTWRLPSQFPPLIEGHPLSDTSTVELEDLLKEGSTKLNNPVSTYQDDYAKGTYACMELEFEEEYIMQRIGHCSLWLTSFAESQNADKCLPPISAATSTASGITLSPPGSQLSGSGPHSEMHEAYQMPQNTQHLKGNTSRYGCSSNYVKAACGVVPTLHPIVNAPNYQTWYANEFGVGAGNSCGFGGHRRPPTPIYPLHLPPILKDRTQLTARSSRPCTHQHDSTTPTSNSTGPNISNGTRDTKSAVKIEADPDCRGAGGLSWLSEWAGPM